MFAVLLIIATFVGRSESEIACEHVNDPQDFPFNPSRKERGIVDDGDTIIGVLPDRSSDVTRPFSLAETSAETIELILLLILILLTIMFLLIRKFRPQYVRPIARLIQFISQFSRFRQLYNIVFRAHSSSDLDEEEDANAAQYDSPPSVDQLQEFIAIDVIPDDASSASYKSAQSYEELDNYVEQQRLAHYNRSSSLSIQEVASEEDIQLHHLFDAEVSIDNGENYRASASPANLPMLVRDMEVETRR